MTNVGISCWTRWVLGLIVQAVVCVYVCFKLRLFQSPVLSRKNISMAWIQMSYFFGRKEFPPAECIFVSLLPWEPPNTPRNPVHEGECPPGTGVLGKMCAAIGEEDRKITLCGRKPLHSQNCSSESRLMCPQNYSSGSNSMCSDWPRSPWM